MPGELLLDFIVALLLGAIFLLVLVVLIATTEALFDILRIFVAFLRRFRQRRRLLRKRPRASSRLLPTPNAQWIHQGALEPPWSSPATHNAPRPRARSPPLLTPQPTRPFRLPNLNGPRFLFPHFF